MKLIRSKASTELYAAKSLDDRQKAAASCNAALEFGIPTFVDDMENSVESAYAALPTRLYLIGLDGKVIYAGGLGPWGFKPKELKTAIEDYLSNLA